MSGGSTTQSLHTPGETIAAISTAIGCGAIGIVRLSGPDAVATAARTFAAHSGADPLSFASHTVHLGYAVAPDSRVRIDQCLLTVFRAPASYTGEDVVEMSCHGGAVAVRRVLEAVLAAGARPADPGEFTKRAFLNGRLDLAQAEAVNDLIRARTDEARRLAVQQISGALSDRAHSLSERLLTMLGGVHASVDFPDDVPEPSREDVAVVVSECAAGIDELHSSLQRGRIFREGITLAIVGRPNVGKSSLLNALLRHERAIVTPIPGTTRDVIEESLSIRGIPVVAADTAGLRNASEEVERIGVRLAEDAMAAACVVIVVLDASSGLTDEDIGIASRAGERVLVVLNKTDMLNGRGLESALRSVSERTGRSAVAVSAKCGTGIEWLEDAIAGLALGGKLEAAESAIVTNARHGHALAAASQSLREALATLQTGLPLDLVCGDLQSAVTSLGEITGESASVDLLDRIFSAFCIGK